MLATLVIALTGLTMAQTSPKQAAKPAKKEAAAATAAPAPAKDAMAKEAKKAGHHHKNIIKQLLLPSLLLNN
ncbi:hypothetical protein [Paraflavitalea speifideaquila]|uniref:hypothetical protein n=1 Tax=Paraflavitalea speifideaquila TaxID=3076558 RepID=UPI0028E2F8DF|nr:hypothetical protein [Paraflavitalea speifideiaquila]